MTIDLESISHRYLMESKYLSKEINDSLHTEDERRAFDAGALPQHTRKILAILAKYGHTVTFFVVGELHSWYPTLLREIVEQGHEVAFHSHTHGPLETIDSLRKEIDRSKVFIQSYRPKGFRAPQARMPHECLGELSRQGFLYDSSSYGPFEMSGKIDGIIEIPISTYSFLGKKSPLMLPRHMSLDLALSLEIPFGSGYFISLMSSLSPKLIGYFIDKTNRKGCPSVLCIHPWQLFQKTGGPISLRNFGRLGFLPYDVSCYRAFEYLVKNYHFFSISELIEDLSTS